jgi:predicted phage baseplate assembly protein
MPLALPDLDTRRFEELVLEGRSRIPMRAPGWTDHNLSDPGIVLVELLAYLIESDVYRANRVPDRNRRKLLALVGERPAGPTAGRAVVAATPTAGAPDSVPAGTEIRVHHGESSLPATLLSPLPLVATAVRAVQTMAGGRVKDVTTRLATTGAVTALGDDPAAGDALAIGLDGPPPAGRSVALHLDLDGPAAEDEDAGITAIGLDPAVHHGASTVWEVLDAGGAWTALPDTAVADPTRALTRPGIIVVTLPQIDPVRLGTVVPPLAWLRCRLAAGRPDKAPVLRGVTANAAAVTFATRAFEALQIAPGTTLPAVAAEATLAFDVDPATGSVVRLVLADAAPAVAVLDFAPGRLALEAASLGRGDGTPEQEFTIPGAPLQEGARVWLLEADGGHAVRLRDDFDASGRRDRDAVLDASTGTLTFGDGRRGRVPPAGSSVLATWSATSAGAAAGLRPPALVELAPTPGNRLRLNADPSVVAQTLGLALVSAVSRAADAEDPTTAAGRVERRVWAHERLVEALADAGTTTLDDLDPAVVAGLAVPERAITLADHERIALATPGASIARARAFAEMHPDIAPRLRAAGCVTVVVMPWLPAARPQPSGGLLEAVTRTLAPCRLVGTRVFAVGPTYVAVDVTLVVAPSPGADPASVRSGVDAALGRFLHPITGGAGARGWRFGRSVYRSEIMQLVEDVDGVDHVDELALASAGETPTCGNLAIDATALVVAGTLSVAVAG